MFPAIDCRISYFTLPYVRRHVTVNKKMLSVSINETFPSNFFLLVCRALGIPCRSVTNFDSAHDTDVSLTIDRFVDENEDSIKRMNSDSVWWVPRLFPIK